MPRDLRLGIIGFDTSHVPAFTRMLNDPKDPFYVPGGKVVCGFPSFSADIPSSVNRVEGFKRDVVEKYGVKLVGSIEELVGQVDAVLLESNDGRRHLPEVKPVLAARKPVFIDKPLAANYKDAAEIVRLARAAKCPLFSASSLRYDANLAAIKADTELGAVNACDAFTPASLDPTNPGLFWYGVHGVEILYTFMGPGCQAVRCQSNDRFDIVIGRWADGRVGTVRGTRVGPHDYGATVFGEKKVRQAAYSHDIPLYNPLLKVIIALFQGGSEPVAPEETLEMMAFMQAALVSAGQGREVPLAEVR